MDSYDFITRNGQEFFNFDGEVEQITDSRGLHILQVKLPLRQYERLKELAPTVKSSAAVVLRCLVCEGLGVDLEDIEGTSSRIERGGVAHFYYNFGDLTFLRSELEDCADSIAVEVEAIVSSNGKGLAERLQG